MQKESEKLGSKLKAIRVNKKITQSELAVILGVDKSFVSNIENGKNNPTLSTIASLAKALKVKVEDLFK
jgi:transcriptional regulator with XRE-family HTH domain